MLHTRITKNREYGDFQTPSSLATQATQLVKSMGLRPKSIIEPTCGRGQFLLASIAGFPNAQSYVGVDINSEHLRELKNMILSHSYKSRIRLIQSNFFELQWSTLLNTLPEPILIIGNPPWVTNSVLSALGSKNIPEKSNFANRSGLEAITGKSNFDISEWMILKHFEWLRNRRGAIAMLCKNAVARKVLAHAWKEGLPIHDTRIYRIDAQKYFNVAVDACFFVSKFGFNGASKDCKVFNDVYDSSISDVIGYRDNTIVRDVNEYDKWSHLRGADYSYVWRSGIKHDNAKVMELISIGNKLLNGHENLVSVESSYLYPLLKSSDIANGRHTMPSRYLLVTQNSVGEDTTHIQYDAPKTWSYLKANAASFSKRGSSIYKKHSQFSIFGVGAYSFTPWKVAISALYKKLDFKPIGPMDERPVVFDDTICFLPCWSRQEAYFLVDILNSPPAKAFLNSMIFWADKRPITIDLLKRLNLYALSCELDKEKMYLNFTKRRGIQQFQNNTNQLCMNFRSSYARPRID